MPLTPTHHTIRANGSSQHDIDMGDGPPGILLHGFPETSYVWRKQTPALATRYRLIIPDLAEARCRARRDRR